MVGRYVAVMSAFCLARNVRNRGVVVLVFVLFTVVVFFCLGSGTAHEPPSTLVMKEQRWFVAKEMVTQLLDSSGEVSCFPKLCVPSHIYLIIR